MFVEVHGCSDYTSMATVTFSYSSFVETDLGGGGAFFLTVGYDCSLRPLLALCDIVLIGASHKMSCMPNSKGKT